MTPAVDRRTRLLLLVGLPLVAAVAFYVGASVAVGSPTAPYLFAEPGAEGVEEPDPERVEERVHERANAVRDRHAVDPVTRDGDLTRVARYHGRDMANRSYLAHVSPDGETMADRFDRFDVDCPHRGENLHYERVRVRAGVNAIGVVRDVSADEAARRIVDGWLASDGHRENLVDPNWTAHGIGVVVVRSGDYLEFYATQNFCNEDGEATFEIE